jgi:hypothetical protein
MPDSIMYQEDGFVVLEADQPEQFLTAEELQAKLQGILMSEEVNLPRDLQKFDSIEKQAEYLMNNYFELDVGVDRYLQWYVVRLEK